MSCNLWLILCGKSLDMISRGFVNYREWRLAHLVSSCVSHKRVALDVQILKGISNHIVIFDIDIEAQFIYS